MDAECVYVLAHRLAQRIIDQAMTLQKAFAGKLRSNNGDVEVAAAFACAGMAGMFRALILDLETQRLQRRAQALFHLGDTLTHGNTLRNGCTSTVAYTPTVTYGSACAQARASSSESNSATIRLPV